MILWMYKRLCKKEDKDLNSHFSFKNTTYANIMDFPTKKQPSTSDVGNTQYIHQFGYHFARRLLGEKQVNAVCRQGKIIAGIAKK